MGLALHVRGTDGSAGLDGPEVGVHLADVLGSAEGVVGIPGLRKGGGKEEVKTVRGVSARFDVYEPTYLASMLSTVPLCW